MTDHDSGRHVWLAPAHLAVAAALCVMAAVLRAGPLGPSSLWLDDAWVALVSKTSGTGDTFMVGLTGPGFAFVLKGWLALVGFSETAAQLPAFVFGVVAPGLLYLVAVARGFTVAGAVVAGGLLAAAPVHIVYSTRVKHYTLDVVLAIALIALAWRVIESAPSRRAWVALAAGAGVAVAMSGGVVPVAVAALGAGLLASLRRGRPAAIDAAVACGAWLGFAVGWYVLVLRPAITPAIRAYWADRYVGSVGELVSGVAALLEGFSGLPAPVVAVGLVAGAVALAVTRPFVAVLAVGTVAGVAVLAAAGVAPLGGGRTDAFVYPVLALTGGALVHWLAQRRMTVGLALGAVVLVAGVAAAGFAPPYPAEDVRPLVGELEQRRRPGEVVLVYPSTVWAYALYTDDAVAVVAAANPWGFRPTVNDTGVILLEAHRDDPAQYGPAVAAGAGSAERLWLLSSHHREDLRVIAAHLDELGFDYEERWRDDGAALGYLRRR